MTNSEESENRLKEKFNKELLPTWDFEKIFLEYGKKLLEKKEFQKAVNIFDDVLYVYPENIKAQTLKNISNIRFLENQARSYLGEHKIGKAIKSLEDALDIDPDDAEIRNLLEYSKELLEKEKKSIFFKLIEDNAERTIELKREVQIVPVEFKNNLALFSGKGLPMGEITTQRMVNSYLDSKTEIILHENEEWIVLFIKRRYEDELIFIPKKT